MAEPEDVLLDAIDKIANDYVDRAFQLSQQNLVADGKIDTGILLKSGNINRFFLDKEIVYTAPHAEPIEFGRVAGTMPPVDPIIRWVLRKGFANNQVTARKIAWAVAVAIKQRGLDPSPYLEPALEQTSVEFKRKVFIA